MKKIIYCSGVCSDKIYTMLLEKDIATGGQQIQKYHKLLIRGLSVQEGIIVSAISKLPISNMTFKLDTYREVWNNIHFFYFPCFRNNIFNYFIQIFMTYKYIVTEVDEKKNDTIFLDVLNVSMGIGAVFAKKIKKIELVGIVTDIPEMMFPHRSLASLLCNWIIRECDKYLLLTDMMNECVNPRKEKPFIVLEGHVDSEMSDREKAIFKNSKIRVCLYAGSLHRIHGIEYLVKGFIKANIQDCELHIYGNGDFVDELLNICEDNANIKYYGVVDNKKIVQEELRATLLINPRPTNQIFTRYSFPSKNMEYMVSGTPLLTTLLPGMPREYLNYVYIIDLETEDGIAKKIRELMEMEPNKLQEKGKLARTFVLSCKTEIKQAEKIVNALL